MRTSTFPSSRLPNLLLLAAVLLAPATIAPAGNNPESLSGTGFAGFRLHNVANRGGPSLMTWTAPGICGDEFPRSASIGLINGGLGPWQSPAPWIEIASGCDILNGTGGDVVRDDTYVYFFSERILRRKPLWGRPADPNLTVNLPVTLPILPPDQDASALEMASGTIYWGRYTSSTGSLAIYKADPVAGTGSLVTSIPGADSTIRKIRFVSLGLAGPAGALAIQLQNGKLYRFKFDGSELDLLATGVTDFVPHTISTVPPFSNSYLFASKGSLSTTTGPNPPTGSVVRINAATGDSTTIYTATGGEQVQSVAVDPGTSNGSSGHNLYLSQAPVDCFELLCVLGNHKIRRSTAANLANAMVGFETILNDDGGTNLSSDGQFLYYIHNGVIQRICTDADPVSFDLAALDLEVVQCTQDLAHGAVIVSGREGTVVRAYAHIALDNTGGEGYQPFATLDARVNGTPLPGSPFYPVRTAVVTAEQMMLNLRSQKERSYFFELPPLPSGELRLEFTVNPNQNPAETDDLSNNTHVETVPVLAGSKICLVTVPVHTGKGTYNPSHWSFPPILQRAQSMLPVSKIELRCWQPLATGAFHTSDILAGDPFFPDGFDSDDKDYDGKCLDAIDCLRKFSSHPSGCGIAAWHGLIKFNIANFAGLGRRPGRSAISEMQYDPGNFDRPRGGQTIAHELGHNFGRRHVDCQDPANPDPNYPYDPCTIGIASPNGFMGYDRITDTIVMPTTTGDVMSYAGTTWPSDYTWNGIYWSMFASSPPAGGAPVPRKGAAGNEQVLFVMGRYDPAADTVQLGNCLLRPQSHWDPANLAADFSASDALLGDPDAMVVEALDRDRRVLSSTAVPLQEESDHVTESFGHFVPFPENARFVQLLKNRSVLATKLISAHPPEVTLDPPIVDLVEEQVRLSWQASDQDGDPLSFLVQYSSSNGQTWSAYQVGYTGLGIVISFDDLPGSDAALFRIVASDGVLTGTATSDPVTIPKHGPVPTIAGILEGERIPFGSPKRLIGLGLDVEDGTEGVSILWSGSVPPSNSESIGIGELQAGFHQVTLTATDRDGMSSMTTLNFEILPPTIPEASSAPVIDGVCEEAAWGEARMIRITNASEPRYVRLLHHGGNLYAAFDNLSYGLSREPRDATMLFDLNRNGIADAADRGFSIDQNGIPTILTGDGISMVPDPAPPYGTRMAVTRGTSSWCAEIMIPDSLLGGWDQNVPMLLKARGASFPKGADAGDPATWPETGLRATLPGQPNRPPVAEAGPNEVLSPQNTFTYALSGDQSYDPDGDPLTYQWTQLLGPTVFFDDATVANPTFTLPQTGGFAVFRFQLVVTDGSNTSSSDDVVIEVWPTTTQQPSLGETFGFSEDGFHGRFTGLEPDQRYFLRRSRNLENDWVTIGTITADGFGALNFFDLIEPGVPSCFYQAVEAP